MAEQHCGKWYCHEAPGFKKLEPVQDVEILFPTVDSNDRSALDAQSEAMQKFAREERLDGFTGWIAGQGHERGAAHYFWVWDVNTADYFMEYRIFQPGTVPVDFGDLHRGRGWQFPLLAVFTGDPTERDLAPLRRNRIPYVLLDDEEEPGDDPGDEPGEPCPPCPPGVDDDTIIQLESLLTSMNRLIIYYKIRKNYEVVQDIRLDLRNPLRRILRRLE